MMVEHLQEVVASSFDVEECEEQNVVDDEVELAYQVVHVVDDDAYEVVELKNYHQVEWLPVVGVQQQQTF